MSDTENDVGGPADRGLLSQVGPLQVDWPRSMGYFGGIALALALDVINPPVAVFIASIPFLKMLNRPGAAKPVRIVSQFFDGMAKPVGGDGTSTVKLADAESSPAGSRTGRRPRGRPRTAAARLSHESAPAPSPAPPATSTPVPTPAATATPTPTRTPRRAATTTSRRPRTRRTQTSG